MRERQLTAADRRGFALQAEADVRNGLGGRQVHNADLIGAVTAVQHSGEAAARMDGHIDRKIAQFDLPDVFRGLNGWKACDVSWVAKRGEDEVGRRFDHVFASKNLKAHTCEYVHEWREQRLSDHSAIETVFAAEGSD